MAMLKGGLNDISTHHSVRLCGSPEILGYVEIEIASEFIREGPVHQFVVPEPALGMSKQNIKKTAKCSLVNQHMTL
jgi:hypothetical protein